LWLGIILALAAGLSPYLYLPWGAAHPSPVNQIDPSSLRRILEVFLRKAYGTLTLTPYAQGSRIMNMTGQLKAFFQKELIETRFMGFLAVLIGLWTLWRRDRALAGALLGFLALSLPCFLWLANLPATPEFIAVIEKQYGAPLIVFCVFSAAGLSSLFSAAKKFRCGESAGVLLAALLPLSMLAGNYREADRSADSSAERMGLLVLDSVPPKSVIFSCYDTMSYALHELRDGRGVRPDVVLSNFAPGKVEADAVRARLPELHLTQAEGARFSREIISRAPPRPVYFTFINECNGKDLLGDIRGHLIPEGLVYRWAPARNLSATREAVDHGLSLLARRPEMTSARAGQTGDEGLREIILWYSDAYYNLGVMLQALGRADEARAVQARALEMRK
jgi:hypothetical protein